MNPLRVGKINPVNVCILMGTPANFAANIVNNPALGVIEWTIVGRSFFNSLYNLNKDTRSLKGRIFLCMLMAMVVIPSLSRTKSSSFPGLEIPTIVKCRDKNLNCPFSKIFNEIGTVDVRMILIFFINIFIQLNMLRNHFFDIV